MYEIVKEYTRNTRKGRLSVKVNYNGVKTCLLVIPNPSYIANRAPEIDPATQVTSDDAAIFDRKLMDDLVSRLDLVEQTMKEWGKCSD